MRIKRLGIHNYRSIKDLTLECGAMVCMLGPNNHGKSNILSALEYFLTGGLKPVEADFFQHRDPEDRSLWVEVTFDELTEQEVRTFQRYVLSDGTLRVRKTARMADGGALEVSYNGYTEQPAEPWLQADRASEYTNREAINATPLRDLMPETGRLSKAIVEEAQQRYIQDNRDSLTLSLALESGNFLGQKNIAAGILPELLLVPAVRDLSDEIKVKTTTVFGRLLNRAIQDMAQRDARFAAAREQLAAVIASLTERMEDPEQTPASELIRLERGIEEELRTWGVRVNIEVSPPEIEKLFELGTDVFLDDGVRTSATRKGHGLQRALMFALIRAWSKALRTESQGIEDIAARKRSESVIFAVEEPELFLHPHAQRRLFQALRDIAAVPEHQVMLCTHSPHFIDTDEYRQIAMVYRDNPQTGTSIRQCTSDLFAGEDLADRKKRFRLAHWINPERAEMFFCRKAVFVEGETERVLLPYLADRLGLLDSEVSVIDCGSKFNLPFYIELAKAFGIRYAVVHDEDPLPNPVPADWSDDKRRASQRTFDLNAEIEQLVEAPLGQRHMLSPDFESATGVPKNQGDKKGKGLAALDYFEQKQPNEIPEVLKELLRAVYRDPEIVQ